MKTFDAVVIGLGGMGSAIAYDLASHGARVLGLEKFSLNHTNGSSHGRTRIIRTAYFEHPNYVPLVKRAMDLWLNLQAESGMDLFKLTGGIMFGPPESELISGSIESANRHALPHETLSSEQVKSRFPAFQPDESETAVYESNAGILFPEKCIEAHTRLAKGFGAELHFNDPLIEWRAERDGVFAKTESESYHAKWGIFASGAWLTELIPELKLPLQCERQTAFWFKPSKNESLFIADKMPFFIWCLQGGNHFYGIPDFGEGVKVARHHGGEYTSPAAVNRKVTEQDEMPVRHFLDSHTPWASGSVLSSTTCLYTNSPDGHFLIDQHPKHRNIVIVSACSGHGFKFAAAIGEIVREMVLEGKTTQDISLFNIERFHGNE